MYSASSEDIASIFCFVVVQRMDLSFNSTSNPVIDFQVYLQPAQSASQLASIGALALDEKYKQ